MILNASERSKLIIKVNVNTNPIRTEEQYIRSLSENDQKKWVQEIIGRMCEVYGLKGKDIKGQLGRKLGFKGSGTVKSWIFNHRVPFHAMVTCKNEVNCSLDWLLTGDTPVMDKNANVQAALNEILKEHLYNANRYKLVDSNEGIRVTAEKMLEDIEQILNLKFV